MHWVPVTIAQTLLISAGATTSVLWVTGALIASLLSAVVMADFLYRFVEQPARRWMLSLTQPNPSSLRKHLRTARVAVGSLLTRRT